MNSVITILTALIAFAVTWLMGYWLIPVLRKLKFGQTILDIGPKWHKNKQGTPTMGGIMFVIGVVVAVLVAYIAMQMQYASYPVNQTPDLSKLIFGILMALGYGLIGFFDDYIKVVKKRNLGLTAKQKLLLQFAVAIAYMASLYLAGDRSTTLIIPFIGQWNLGVFYYPLMVIFIVGMVNSVNLTDGIDGLASSVTFLVAIGFMILSTMLSAIGMEILSTALAGSCLGFLVWNFHPAKVFMGDTGSMFLGGMVVALGFGIGMPIISAIAGIIYIVESLSVVLQVISFKTTGKRIFKMSPIHHHFEMSGFSEVKIVVLFSAITVIAVALSILSVHML